MNDLTIKPYNRLEESVHAALETYSNVHRGSGHFSVVTTILFERAREIVLEYLNLDKTEYLVIFSTPLGIEKLIAQIKGTDFQVISSQDLGLPLAVRAVAVRKKNLPKSPPSLTGGGTTRLVSPDSVIWADAPDRFEPGTPAVINIIAFAKVLQLARKYGNDVFQNIGEVKDPGKETLHADDFEGSTGHELLSKLRQTLIGKNTLVPTMNGEKPFINFDNAASTPTFEPVWNVFRKSLVQPTEIQHKLIDEVKTICTRFLGASPSGYDVIFTSNTTEAINLAAEGLSYGIDEETEPVLVSSLLEHSSNDLPWRTMKGFSVIRLTIDHEGFFDVKELESLLISYNKEQQFGKKRIKIVAISGASNVLGTFNNLTEVSRLTHQYGAHLFVDAAQLVAHRKIEMEKTGIDFLAFSAHKVYAPFGCGVLVVKKGLLNFSFERMEQIKTQGEENVGGIAALGKALILLQKIGFEIIQKEEQELTSLALRKMSAIPNLKIYGTTSPDSPQFGQKGGVIPFEIKNTMPKTVAQNLTLHNGIGVRYGCHCSHILVKHILNIGPFIQRLQNVLLTVFPTLQLQGVVRISFGIENTPEEVETFIHTLENFAKKPGNKQNSIDAKNFALSKAEAKKQMDAFARNAIDKIF